MDKLSPRVIVRYVTSYTVGAGPTAGLWHPIFGFPLLSCFLEKKNHLPHRTTAAKERHVAAGSGQSSLPRMNGATERIHHYYIELFLH